MLPQPSEDEVDDLLYFARVGDMDDFYNLANQLGKRDNIGLSELLPVVKDSYSGNGPLHMAAANGHTEILSTIIKGLSGSSPQNATQLAILNAQNAAGNTALHWAALNGHLECIKVLIDSGADPTIINVAGHDAVYEAEINDKKEVVEWVLKEGQGLEESIGGLRENEDELDENAEDRAESRSSNGNAADEEAVRAGMHKLGMEDGMKDS